MTQKTDVNLKMIKKCLIDKIYVIGYNQLRLHIKVHKLMNNKKKIYI